MANKRRRHAPDRVIRKIAEGNKLVVGRDRADEVCRHLQIAESTWHRWVGQYGGMKASDAKHYGVGFVTCPARHGNRKVVA